jgi:uncharacterized protein (DUF362 family)
MKKKQPVVSIVKSSTGEYSKTDFRDMVQRSLQNLEESGIQPPSSGTVFIKPNVVIGAPPTQGIATDPRFISALISLLKERGVETVYVGDSSASYIRSQDSWREIGMDRAARDAGGLIVDIDNEEQRIEIEMPASDIVHSLTVPRKAIEADCLINFTKLKTHRIGSLTGCVKNWVGFLSQTLRLENHQTRLPKLVAELHRALPEHLCFIDALIVGEGDGPDICSPRFLGALLASNDPVAIDSIGADLLHVHRGDLTFAWTAHREGVGEIERNQIRVIGCSVESLAIEVEKPVEVLYNRFPCNIVLGGLCEGCFAWFMGPALFWERDGIWDQINKNVGRPTFMFGFNAVDLHFDNHLKEGPYFVVGDCPPERFREDPRTIHIPGCCPGPKIPEIVLEHCTVTKDKGQK